MLVKSVLLDELSRDSGTHRLMLAIVGGEVVLGQGFLDTLKEMQLYELISRKCSVLLFHTEFSLPLHLLVLPLFDRI